MYSFVGRRRRIFHAVENAKFASTTQLFSRLASQMQAIRQLCIHLLRNSKIWNSWGKPRLFSENSPNLLRKRNDTWKFHIWNLHSYLWTILIWLVIFEMRAGVDSIENVWNYMTRCILIAWERKQVDIIARMPLCLHQCGYQCVLVKVKS